MRHTMGESGLHTAYTIREIHDENPTVRSLVLAGSIPATPGQFVMAWLPGLDEKPFSLSGSDPAMLTIARVGPFTTALHRLAPGDRIWLRGPFGRGFSLDSPPLVLIGGGCGTAPLLYLAKVARQAGHPVHAVLGARTAEGLFFQGQLEELGCEVTLSTDDGSAGTPGSAVDACSHLLGSGKVAAGAVYACGPAAMLDAATRLALSHGLPCQLCYEAYMRCGIGVCGSCALEGCLVCRDGPVLPHPPGLAAP